MTYGDMEAIRLNDIHDEIVYDAYEEMRDEYNSDSGYYKCRICGNLYTTEFSGEPDEFGFNDVCLGCLKKSEDIDDVLTELEYDDRYDKDEFIFDHAQEIADYLF